MAARIYDIIIVGGGLAGAAFAKSMADSGARVLVLEREINFKDRVRGEILWPWGVTELRELGIASGVTDAFAFDVPWFDIYLDGHCIDHRDLRITTKQGLAALNWVHNEMEEVLLDTAQQAGAEVWRGARAFDVTPGKSPSVTVERFGRVDQLHSRLVVCANGRRSAARKWAGFEEKEETYGMLIGGVLLGTQQHAPADVNNWLVAPATGHCAFVAPQREGRLRA